MLLDTNAISAWAKGDAALLQALRPDRTWYLPGIALGEYRYGLLKSTRRVELEAWLESVEAACVVLAADGVTARHYAELRRALDAGQGEVPYHDIWIGALALQHNVEVVSRDAHFDAMPGVRRIGWQGRKTATVLRPIAEQRGLGTREQLAAYAAEEWVPSRIAFGQHKGKVHRGGALRRRVAPLAGRSGAIRQRAQREDGALVFAQPGGSGGTLAVRRLGVRA